jgi:hypothetical protein
MSPSLVRLALAISLFRLVLVDCCVSVSEHLGPTVDSVVRLNDEFDNIITAQHHIRVREQIHRDSALFWVC